MNRWTTDQALAIAASRQEIAAATEQLGQLAQAAAGLPIAAKATVQWRLEHACQNARHALEAVTPYAHLAEQLIAQRFGKGEPPQIPEPALEATP